MRFSIIIPSYNVEPYVSDCIHGLQRQTYADFQAIIVDDGSTDETVAVARRLIKDDPRFQLIEQARHNGPGSARNAGLDHATGDFLLFLDSDDYYVPETLELMNSYIEVHDLDMLFFAARSFYENRRLRRVRYEDQETRRDIDGIMTGPDMFVAMAKKRSFRPSACLWTIKRSLIEDAQLRFREDMIHEDLLFTLMAFPLGNRTEFINVPLYQRRLRENSIMTTTFSMNNVDGMFKAGQIMWNWLNGHASDPRYQEDFLDAMAARILDNFEVAARYLWDIDQRDMKAYRDTLTLKDRCDFDLHVLGLSRSLGNVRQEYLDSRTYRLGHMLLAGPSFIRSRIVMPNAKVNENDAEL